jgi:aspartate-semialdehyde dehydrogenase
MSAPLLRLGVIGATGTVGREVLGLLEERRFPLQELVPVATDRSLGEHVELLGHEIPVTTEPPTLRGLDLLLLCTPPGAALEWVRRALQAEVPVIDVSGALAEREEVVLAGEEADAGLLAAPLVAAPAGRVLGWARVLRALGGVARLRGVQVAALDAAAAAGRAGVDALQAETVGIFQQQEVPASEVFGHPVAFDCVPRAGGEGAPEDRRAEAELPRLVPGLAALVATVRVPAFSGSGATLFVDLEDEVPPDKVKAALGDASGVALVDAEGAAGTRAVGGSDAVAVGALRVRGGPAPAVALFAAADPVRLVAAHALRLAERRFGRPGA